MSKEEVVSEITKMFNPAPVDTNVPTYKSAMFKLYGKRLLLKPLRDKDTTDSGIILPESLTFNKSLPKAEILAVSDELLTEFSVGEIVVLDMARVRGVNFDKGEEYVIAFDHDIILRIA
jgi:co-chaperonin GroES (HSP10)